jgi:hypothetical protein
VRSRECARGLHPIGSCGHARMRRAWRELRAAARARAHPAELDWIGVTGGQAASPRAAAGPCLLSSYGGPPGARRCSPGRTASPWTAAGRPDSGELAMDSGRPAGQRRHGQRSSDAPTLLTPARPLDGSAAARPVHLVRSSLSSDSVLTAEPGLATAAIDPSTWVRVR